MGSSNQWSTYTQDLAVGGLHPLSRAPIDAVEVACNLGHVFKADVRDVDAVARLALARAALALKALHKVLKRRARELAVGKRLLELVVGLFVGASQQ